MAIQRNAYFSEWLNFKIFKDFLKFIINQLVENNSKSVSN